jgi:hypothetical protein
VVTFLPSRFVANDKGIHTYIHVCMYRCNNYTSNNIKIVRSYFTTDGQSVSQSVSQYVLVSSTLVGLATRYYFLSECCCLKFAVLFLGRPLWREDGSAICSVIAQWSESRRTSNHYLLSGASFSTYINTEWWGGLMEHANELSSGAMMYTPNFIQASVIQNLM